MIETRHTFALDRELAGAAFGARPGDWPLPTARTPHQLWLRAVACGGQGRYGNAFDDLAALRRTGDRRLVSLAHSTHGSFVRQLGWHTAARGWDGRALALAGDDPESSADALIGLAADALGVGRFAASAALLARADEAVAAGPVPDRIPVRRAWVGAELAMASGDGPVAVRRAEEAVELARTMAVTSVRHRVKSDVVLAAALCSAGGIERARAVAEAALRDTGRYHLTPLRWALSCLLIDIGSVTFSARKLQEIRDICAGQVRHAGGTWRSA
ncbi:hypothetical protein [Mycobacterium sp. Marseille-P9652]|uniref:hypothetical protein n=1 Tax=Mycobacterium sp. Marseille-P9652 TaxID=2654950 RepID=UPI001E4F2E4C|nr:hypothetical protein [Mycobacterium sp. Marseille-P9652]